MDAPPVAIITGASRGIGKTVAFGLAEQNYKVVLVARSKAMLEKVADEILATAVSEPRFSPVVCPADVSDERQVADLISYIANKYHRIDILFNNAGKGTSGSLELDIEQFDELLAVNLRGPFCFLKHVVPIMKRQKSGYIFNLASRNGKVGVSGLGGYVASKYGLVGLSEVVYRELASEGIKITTLCPGWVNTQMASDGGCPHDPLDIIQPEDILKSINWLLQLSPAVSIMEVLIENMVDVEKRSTIPSHNA